MSTGILKEIRLTEKANLIASELNQYVFDVYPCANKYQIAKAVAEQFGVKVWRVNIMHQRGKAKMVRSSKSRKFTMTSGVKKAIVSLVKGEKINIA